MSVPLDSDWSLERQVAEDRRSSWTTRLLADRSFRVEQIELLDRQLAVSPALTQDGVTQTLRASAQTALNEIDDALARLVTGKFGRCVRCRQPIGAERLDVLPMAAQCMPCHYDAETRPDRATPGG